MSRAMSFLRAAFLAALSWYVYYQLAVFFNSNQPVFLASIVLGSIIIHEMGHWVVMEYNGIKTHLVFYLVVGGAMADKRYQHVMKNLPWSNQAAIYMAGVIAHLALVLISWFFQWGGLITAERLSRIANLNGLFIMFNLLPWWKLDGGHFMRVLFNSVPEKNDERFVRWISLFVTFAIGLMIGLRARYFMRTLPDFTLFFVLFFWGLHFRATHDDTKGSRSRLAMSKRSQIAWASIYVACLIISFLLVGLLPHWAYS